jgi:hypothetical protein
MNRRHEKDFSPPSQPSIDPDDFLPHEKGVLPHIPSLEKLPLPDIDMTAVKRSIKSVVRTILTRIHLHKPSV